MAGDLTFALCDTSSAVAPAGWDAAVKESGLHSLWDWSVVRAVRAGSRSALLAGLLRDGDRDIGLVTARLYGVGRRPLAGVVDADCLATTSMPGIALPGAVPGTFGPHGSDPSLLAAAIRAVETTLRHEFGRRIPAIAYRQIHGRELPVVARGATLVREGLPVAVFHNVFRDHDEYLGTLGRSRRKSQRNLTRRVDNDPAVTVYFGPAAGAGLDPGTFHRLVTEAVRRNHRTRWPPAPSTSRAKLAALLALPDTVVLAYTGPDGQFLAANPVLDHPVAPVVGPWGAPAVGAESGRRSGLWFDHYDRLIRRTIERGQPMLLGGKGLPELKAELGLRLEPQWTVVRRLA